MQCEFETQQANRRHYEIWGSWGAYTMEVEKGRNMSQIGGDGWARFLARMRLTGGELIRFSFRAERPKLAVIYLNLVEDDEDDEDNEDPLDEDDENPLH